MGKKTKMVQLTYHKKKFAQEGHIKNYFFAFLNVRIHRGYEHTFCSSAATTYPLNALAKSSLLRVLMTPFPLRLEFRVGHGQARQLLLQCWKEKIICRSQVRRIGGGGGGAGT